MVVLLLALVVLVALPATESAAVDASVSGPQALVGPERKARKQLYWWADGPISVEPRRDGGYSFWAPNGGQVARTAGPLVDPAATVAAPARPIARPGYPDLGYLSGGPIYDLGEGRRLMFVHGERYPTGDPTVFYGSVGLAISPDDGRRWRFLGEIFHPDLPYEEFRRCRDVVNASFGQFVIAPAEGRRHFYAYSIDHDDECRPGYAVFRAPVGEVVEAAERGTVSTWRKLSAGAFSEAALGGDFSDVLPDAQTGDFAVTYNAHLGRFLFVYSHRYPGEERYEWRVAESADAVSWESPVPLGEASLGERYAPSLIGDPARPGHVTGRRFFIYYTASLSGGWDRWPMSTLTRQKVTVADPPLRAEARAR